ncbi:MAG: SusD/RagB family nutrient-binding outer membrane lipoprotein [Muribaculaceae bacterium]
MKFNKILLAAAMTSVLAISATSCSDDYAELNQNPANVSKADPKGLMTQAILNFQPNDYLIWFYNNDYYSRWTQMACPTSGYTDEFTTHGATGGQGSQYLSTLKYRNEIRLYIQNTGDESQRGYEAATTVLTVYLGIFDSDVFGARPYTEACRYKTDGILTPKYDMVDELYETWLAELDEAIAIFQNKDIENSVTQDIAYGGDWAKWAKLANSLKLKIAVRLLAQNKDKAISIANAVASSSVGYIDSMDDDLRFCKATEAKSGSDDYVYGTGNGLTNMGLSANVCDFLLKSLDPRVRFIYTKNAFNSKVVQGFIDEGKWANVPECIKANVVLDDEGNFKEWGGLGEPWVRYYGLPIAMNAKNDPEYAEYYNYGNRYNLPAGDSEKGYYPFSLQQEEMKRGRVDFTVPTVGINVIQDTDNNPLYTMYMTAAEVNLYLAEFKLLGANLPQSAEYYYNRGVRFSVETYDALAAANKIPYYGTTYDYDNNEVSIELKKGELDAMMATDNVKLTGSNAEQLEKVYLQELIHFSLQIDDQFVTARRSGYPKIGSTLLPMVKFDRVALNAIPRHFEFGEPSVTDKMYEQTMEAYKKQGIETLGSGLSGPAYNLGGTPLNTERLWQDIGAPQWGTPNN